MDEVEQAVRWSSHPHPHPPGSTDHPQKVTWVNCRMRQSEDPQQKTTTKEAPLDCSNHRGAQTLSPKCDSRRSTVCKIHQGTVWVPVTYQTLPRARCKQGMSTAILYTCVFKLCFANLLPVRWEQGLTDYF